MPLTLIVSFVVVFALMLLAVSLGLKYFDARRKKQVVEMLHTASGEPWFFSSQACHWTAEVNFSTGSRRPAF